MFCNIVFCILTLFAQSRAHSFIATSGVLPEDTGTKKNESSGFDAPISTYVFLYSPYVLYSRALWNCTVFVAMAQT